MASHQSPPPNPEDLRRLSAGVEDGDADRDREPPLPPRRWRPQSHALQEWRRNLDGAREPGRRR